MDKAAELAKLEGEMVHDGALPLRESRLVFGEGSPHAAVVFVGEAPGFHEDRLGRPFVGRGGQLLNELIQEIGWKRENVYITNIVKRRPPENRDPLPEEIEAYKPYLARQINILDPKIIVALGRFSMNYFLPLAKISRDQGKVFKVSERCVMPLFHPAAALRSTEVLNQLRESFRRLPAILDGVLKGTLAAAVIAEPLPPARAEKKSPQQKLF